MTLTLENAEAHAVSWQSVYPNNWSKPKGLGDWFAAFKLADGGLLMIQQPSFSTYGEALEHAKSTLSV
jgi:hypothetical protein